MIRTFRTALLILPLLSASVVPPAVQAIIPQDSAISWRTQSEAFGDRGFASGFELFYAGPEWFLNALSNPRSRNPFARSFMYDSAGDRLGVENGCVGTLRDVFDVGLLSTIATFTGSESSKTSTSTVAALGGSATWNATPTNGNWVTTVAENNWSSGAGMYPGDIASTTNGDTATFLTSNVTAINVNTTVNIKNITFGVASSTPSSFTIAGNSLLLTSTGQIQIIGNITGTGITETVNAPLVLEAPTATTAAAYSFQNSASDPSNTLIIGGTVTGGPTSSTTSTLTFSGANTGANAVTGAISNGTAGAIRVTKNGNGTWALSGTDANTYTGRTLVTAGTLILNKTAGVTAVSSTAGTGTNAGNTDLQITGTSTASTITGGTVRLDSSNQIVDTAQVGLSGGGLQLNGVQEGSTATAGVGALTLGSTSVIDLSSTSLLHFAASGGKTWTGTLAIWNWSGTLVTGGGAEQLLFGNNTTTASLTQAQLNSISFYSGSGTGFLGTGAWATIGDGEVVPVPEPSTWIGAALALGAIGFTQRRRIHRLTAHRG
jgi:autotransporter-associated beta strand protein